MKTIFTNRNGVRVFRSEPDPIPEVVNQSADDWYGYDEDSEDEGEEE